MDFFFLKRYEADKIINVTIQLIAQKLPKYNSHVPVKDPKALIQAKPVLIGNFPPQLYTAVTRARKCVTIVGDDKTFGEMIENNRQQKRYCGLAEEIRLSRKPTAPFPE